MLATTVRIGSHYRDPDIQVASSSQPFSHIWAFAGSSQAPEQPESGPEQARRGEELSCSPEVVEHSLFQPQTFTAREMLVFADLSYSRSPSGLRTPTQKYDSWCIHPGVQKTNVEPHFPVNATKARNLSDRSSSTVSPRDPHPQHPQPCSNPQHCVPAWGPFLTQTSPSLPYSAGWSHQQRWHVEWTSGHFSFGFRRAGR